MHGVPLKAKPRSLNGNLLTFIKLNDRYMSSRSPKKRKKARFMYRPRIPALSQIWVPEREIQAQGKTHIQ